MKKRRVKREDSAGGFVVNLLGRVVVVVSVVACVAIIISNQSTVAEKEKELAQIQEKTNELEAENGELSRILESEDVDAYMEKLAIESMNYAYPNERRFYDTSRN